MSTKTTKHIRFKSGGSHFGVVGHKIENSSFKIGDLVRWERNQETGDREGYGMIVREDNGLPFVMGWGGIDFRHTDKFTIKQCVISGDLITSEIATNLHNLIITEDEVITVTLDELRKYVPFEFELEGR